MTPLEIVAVVIGAVGLVVGIYYKVRAGKVSGALNDTGALFTTAAHVIDSIKSDVGGDARCRIQTILKNVGKELQSKGLKDLMDSKLKEMNLSDGS